MSLSSPLKQGIFLMILASLFYSAGNAFVMLIHGRLAVSEIIFCRNAFALLFFIPYLIPKRKEIGVKHFKLHVIRCIWAYLNVSLFYFSFRFLNLVDATALSLTYSFFIPFVSRIWLKEPIKTHIWWAIGLGFLGVTLILNPMWNLSLFGSALALFAAFAASFSFSSVRSLHLKGESPAASYFFFYAIGSLLVLPFMLASWVFPTPREWTWLGLLGLLMGVNQILLTKAFQRGSASYLAPISYSSIAFAAYFNWLVFNVSLPFQSLLGSLLIIVGGCLTFYKKQRETAAEMPSKELF